MGEIFGTDGIRDRAGHGWLSSAKVALVARVVGGLLKKSPARFRTAVPKAFDHLKEPARRDAPGFGRVLIGRDTRASGPSIERALARGFASAGVPVASAGVLTTPGVAALTRRWGCAVGVVISASHNPADDNGIKFISPQGFKIPDAAEEAIEAILQGESDEAARGKAPRPLNVRKQASTDYVDFLTDFSRPLSGLKIAVDCANGASSAYARVLFERLGAKPMVVHASPDGRNINRGCGALHPETVAAVVRKEKADLGLAFDGDADRLVMVDEKGIVRDGETVLALCGLHLKEKRKLPKNTIVSTVMANFGLERWLEARGIKLLRTNVGDRYVAEEMLKTGTILGGEPSGHVLFFDAAPAGDGMLTALRVLNVLAERGERLSEAAFPKYPQVLLNVRVARKPPIGEVAALRSAIATAEKSLGADGRILVRYSGTEPVCRVMVEGPKAAMVERLAKSVAAAVEKELA
jgi:phosphoglucosamine mutase